tara:strand:- start:1102 stop:1242 length:141 start_codon:yes stop_codon:yes gene_type:complete
MGGLERKKIIPIVREGSFHTGHNCALPSDCSGIRALYFSNNDKEKV